MKRPMDAFGNELFVNDTVSITMPQGVFIMGRVTAVEDGGLLVPGHTKVSDLAMQIPCKVTVVIEMNLLATPGKQIQQLLKVVQPARSPEPTPFPSA